MSYVVFVSITLLITILGVYVVIENNRKKAREAEKRVFNERLKEISSHFKSKISEFVNYKLIRPKHAPQFNAIVGNFFVVQAHNDDNLEALERVTDQLLATIGKELNKCRENGNMDLLADQLFMFVSELPSAGLAYNKAFYSEILPALISRIQTPDTPAQADTQEAVQNEEESVTSSESDDSSAQQQKAAAL
ncbi:hypothetical protein PRUB_a1195 [Pseudoalteromonas rubra]|uniref:Uncharacterized protein n=1 Tax=Pseudoalteromonas rubra TaxID=43658 RepID=A0A8T0C7H1_9GAMM|nr:hypothetical protein [Pseudoalteromonas rubra]KAF7786583.1 hypothetical protein PRUB_a1195 [Pseudoalteromonas rubra]